MYNNLDLNNKTVQAVVEADSAYWRAFNENDFTAMAMAEDAYKATMENVDQY